MAEEAEKNEQPAPIIPQEAQAAAPAGADKKECMKLAVKGMTCHSCEVLIERKLRKVEGVSKVSVSLPKKEAIIEGEGFTLEQLQEALRGQHYTLHPKGQDDAKTRKWVEIGGALLIMAAAYLIISKFNLLPDLRISQNMSYGFIFLIGLVAAASTCLAVSGGLLLAVSAKFNEAHPELNGWQRMRPHIYFNIGRIVSYALLGGAIGLLGSVLTISTAMSMWISIGASVLMVVIGVQLLHIFPWLSNFQIKLPKGIAHKIYDMSTKEQKSSYKLSATLFGASTFILPCGFTIALQLYVLASGDPLKGALTMLAFSLGTLPSLLTVGLVSGISKGSLQKHIMTFAAVLVIVLGLFNISNALPLTDVDQPKNVLATNVQMVDGKQVAEMSVEGLSYKPHQFTVVLGVPVEWIIDGKDASGCAQVITVPKLGITELLPDGKKTITFTPTQLGKIPFFCTMRMTTPDAAFIVVPDNQT